MTESDENDNHVFGIRKKELRIIFLGTPEFAVASLNALLNADYHVVAVVTAPDKAAGRGMQIQQSAVKQYAVSKSLKVLQPEKLRDTGFLNELKALKADLQIVVAFRMLPEVVWNMPHIGTINVHGSLLPNYRGAAPINWAIINGEKETGVTTFKLQHEIDTGNILLQEKISIGNNETAGELHDKMKIFGAELLIKTLDGLLNGTVKEQPQDVSHSHITHAPKIFTGLCRIDWNKNVNEIHNLIRGLSPYPGAFTKLGEKTLKIFRSEKELVMHSYEPGSYQTDRKTYLKFACDDGFIHVLQLQMEGKKQMTIPNFLRGFKFD